MFGASRERDRQVFVHDATSLLATTDTELPRPLSYVKVDLFLHPSFNLELEPSNTQKGHGQTFDSKLEPIAKYYPYCPIIVV